MIYYVNFHSDCTIHKIYKISIEMEIDSFKFYDIFKNFNVTRESMYYIFYKRVQFDLLLQLFVK